MAVIELVIKIPEEYYEAIKAIPEKQSTTDMLIIRNGTPLPKGHGRLIDAEELKILIPAIETEYKYVHRLIDEAPTIIEADKEVEDADSD